MCLWENPNTVIFIIVGFLDVSLNPKTNTIYVLRPQDTTNNQRKVANHCNHYYFFGILQIDIPFLKTWERQSPTNPDDPFNQFSRSLDMDQYLPTKMEWQFGNMEPVSFESIKEFLNL